MKLYFKDQQGKMRIVEVEGPVSLSQQGGLKRYIEKASTLRVKSAILSVVESKDLPKPEAA